MTLSMYQASVPLFIRMLGNLSEVPSYEDTESSFPELQTRIVKTLSFLQSVSATQIDGSEERPITLKVRGKEISFQGQVYLLNFAPAQLLFPCDYDLRYPAPQRSGNRQTGLFKPLRLSVQE